MGQRSRKFVINWLLWSHEDQSRESFLLVCVMVIDVLIVALILSFVL